jgi:hypothetical protein
VPRSKIISRKDAIALGRSTFNTGKPCKRGHLAERWVEGGGGCVECRRGWRAANRDHEREAQRQWYAANSERRKATRRRRYAANPERDRENARRWRAAHPGFLSWINMIARCENPNHKYFKNYGDRGVTIHPRYRHGENGMRGYECLDQDLGPRPSPKHSIDRIDPEGNDEPENLRWVDARTQAKRPPSTAAVR